jgi:hypothetical protein
MRFKITRHAGQDVPADAMDQLLSSLSEQRSKGRFRKVGREIRVAWGNDEGGGWDRPERQELEREQLLDLIRSTCRAGTLSIDWYAVGPLD